MTFQTHVTRTCIKDVTRARVYVDNLISRHMRLDWPLASLTTPLRNGKPRTSGDRAMIWPLVIPSHPPM